MEVNFKIRFADGDKKFDYLDMYQGSKSLEAISEIILLIIHGLAHEEVIIQATAAKGFRLVLKSSKEGSYEQFIQLFINNPEVIQTLTDYGKTAIYDSLKYIISSCLGIPFVLSNRKAKKKIRQLMSQNEDLAERLDNALKRAHAPVKSQGYSVAINMGRTNIITFDKETLDYLEYEYEDTEEVIESVGVSRFNSRTGTGRFITDINSMSYGFTPSRNLDTYEKNLMADNLKLVTNDVFDPINAVVTKVLTRNGNLKRYRLHAISGA
ncbi:DUF7946 domain-containing protein [Comamonas jiangduensis]|uniref:DUF7946 domain-containing protein n=1 Tax=Comamonas jiangduensis TaxID=1194168 RepID=UPI0028A84FEA|nr:hypothetical protein [Comamonas jiangduensis]